MRLARVTGYDPAVDRMIALGDLVDRGPASAEVLRWFAAGALRTSLLGNLNVLRRLVSGFPLAIHLTLADGRRIGLVHAEVRPGTTWAQVARCRYDIGAGDDDRSGSIVSSLLWGRQRFYCYRHLERDPPAASIDADDRRWVGPDTGGAHE